MTVRASHRSVRAGQYKVRRRVIERAQIFPLFRRVAYLASPFAGCHPLVKLSFVRIGVARRAREARKMIGRGFSWRGTLVTIGAWHRFVAARQFELQFLVLRQRER